MRNHLPTAIRAALGALLLTVTTGVAAQPEPQSPPAPPAGMARIATIAGHWTVTGKVALGGPGSEMTEIATTSEVESVFGGRFLQETSSITSGEMVLTYICTRSYDIFQKRFRMSCLDNDMGLMDIYEGSFEGDRLVLSNVGSQTSYNVSAGPVYSRNILQILSADSFQVDWESSTDGGKTWKLAARNTYQRRTP